MTDVAARLMTRSEFDEGLERFGINYRSLVGELREQRGARCFPSCQQELNSAPGSGSQ